ncbi:anthranilate synthase component I [Salsuginibacillus kocurii]|uniref:anthranilate synthase component I n=1 Tax=Salsuginibacillus kocurii TaxID=427078 RepID=UPI0003673E34|nr:anthranilate synthase component I [Salsuginibacillus kocurii]
MGETTQASFFEQAKTYDLIPYVKQLFSDTHTPIAMVQQLRDEVAFLLESKDEASPWSRYSFIGLNPRYYLRESETGFHLERKNKEICLERATIQGIFDASLEWLNPAPAQVDVPFTGGGVGTVPYDSIERFEPRLNKNPNPAPREPIQFLFCETIVSFDHTRKEVTIIHYGEKNGNDPEAVYEAAQEEVKRIADRLFASPPEPLVQLPPLNTEAEVSVENVTSNYEKAQFLEDVEAIKSYIKSGDTFQTVLSQRFERELNVSAFTVYRVLRMINPSPYLFYLHLGDQEIVGSSPERLVQIQDGHVEIHPIAGTRKRGKTLEEDEALATELLEDEKEKAEHYMLVDLARNDVGRIASYGSVETPVLTEIGRFSHVMHIISKVTGRLASTAHPLEALMASFPAGTVSGAPKIRAMEILQELEPTRRGIYAGGISYIGYDGNIDSCIAIRTIIIKDGKAYVQAGAGVVADSDPESEYQETVNKAKALFQSMEIAEQVFEERQES